MITGSVKSDEARIRITVLGTRRRQREIEVVIDTGYTAALTLPPSLVSALGLNWLSVDRGTLADGTECLFDVYEAKILWDGKERRILVDEADTDPSIGMALLRGYQLTIQIRSRGKVSVKRLPRR